MKKKHRFLKVLLTVISVLVVLAIGFLCLKPIKMDSLFSHSHPSQNYEESLARIETLRKSDPIELEQSGQSILMTHGRKVEKVVVFFHGFTNSPRQFAALGKEFYELGYNVFIPRVPYHGLNQSRSADLAQLTAEDLVGISDEAVDIAQGLGGHVTVAGLSMGGVMAGWAAQMRGDVDLAVLIAPVFGTYKVPDFFLKPSINYLMLRRDTFIWWDKQLKNNLSRPPTTYFGFSSRALGEIRRLGYFVQILGKDSIPAAHSIIVITNAADKAVSKEGIDAVVSQWQKHKQIKTFEFEKQLNLGHDVIDPLQPNQNTAFVYPKLIELMMMRDLIHGP